MNFVLDIKVLYKRSFRYALGWVGSNLDKTTKVNYRNDDIDEVLDLINRHIVGKISAEQCIYTHEILLKKKVSLHRYLVAIYSKDAITDEIIEYVNQNYPGIVILNERPKSASELTLILDTHHKN